MKRKMKNTLRPASLVAKNIITYSGIFGKTTAIVSPGPRFIFLNDAANRPLNLFNCLYVYDLPVTLQIFNQSMKKIYRGKQLKYCYQCNV